MTTDSSTPIEYKGHTITLAHLTRRDGSQYFQVSVDNRWHSNAHHRQDRAIANAKAWIRRKFFAPRKPDYCRGCGSDNLFSGFFDADDLAVPDDSQPGSRYTTFCNECGDEWK